MSDLVQGSVTTAAGNSEWEIVPANTIAGVLLAVLLFYLFFRHFMLVLMIMDSVLGWVRQFSWFPKEGRRAKVVLHWVIALGLFLGYLTIASSLGYLEFIPK